MIFFRVFYLANVWFQNLQLINIVIFGLTLLDLWQSSISDFEMLILRWLKTSFILSSRNLSVTDDGIRWVSLLFLLVYWVPICFPHFQFHTIFFKVCNFILWLKTFLFKRINNRILDNYSTFIQFLCYNVS